MAKFVNDPTVKEEDDKTQTSAESKLVSWVKSRVDSWVDDRNTKHEARWEEYYRLWRGLWAAVDKSRKSERSRLITPALQQAIESVTSEIESAILDKPHFFDMIDDVEDEENEDVMLMRRRLREDMKSADFEGSMNQIFLMGSLWGTGIGKLRIVDTTELTIVQGIDGPEAVEQTVQRVELDSVLPAEFAIDPAAKNIKEALGVAHVYTTPTHEVEALQKDGTYFDVELHGSPNPEDPVKSDETPQHNADTTNIIEYYGLVPASLLTAVASSKLDLKEDEEVVDLFVDDEEEANEDLVEALVTIGNGTALLKATENPTLLKERLIIAYRHEIVPDQFWGRGVAEKGYNSQKGLDGQVRARMDGLALTVHPMMGIDASKLPKGFTFSVAPGKSILTTGNPSEILHPINFGRIDPNVFTSTAELERMVSQSTGGFDTAAPTNVNNRNETLGGMSLQLGSFVKRSKRTIRNIENEFIIPMVSMTARLYMQINPDRYPVIDVKFKAVSVLGSMARELEQSQFAAMLQTMDPNSPAFWLILKSVYELSSLSNREEIVKLIEQEAQKRLNPPPPPPDPMLELKRAEMEGKLRVQVGQLQIEYIRAQAEIARAANDARTQASEEAKNESIAILNLAKAQAEDLNKSINLYKSQLDALERQSMNTTGVAENVIKTAENAAAGISLGDLLDQGSPTPQGAVAGNPQAVG